MRKSLYALLIGAIALGSSALLAKTGVLVHEKDGTITFYPSEDVEFVEFVEDYEDDANDPDVPDNGDNTGDTDKPSEDPSTGDVHDPSSGENNGGNETIPENPGDNNGGNDNTGGNGGNTDNDKPEDPGHTENPGNSNGDNGSNEEKPSNPSEGNGDSNTTKPEEPGNTPESPETPSEPEKPENPTPETHKAFTLFTESQLSLNKTYLIVANGECAGPVETSKQYGYLPSSNVTISNNIIEGNLENGFIFTNSVAVSGKTYTTPSGKFMIQDSNGRYLLLNGTYTSYNLSDSPELNGSNISEACLFSAKKNSDGTWNISNTQSGQTRSMAYSSSYDNFAAYFELKNTDSYPVLYILGDVEGAAPAPSIPETPDKPGSPQEDPTPDSYKFPLSYVKLPEGTPQQVKDYTGFTVNFNKDNHTPNYVAWELLESETDGSVSRSNSYWVDTEMEGCLSKDYGYSTFNYERGHMCPAAENKWSSQAMKDCMVMTNMCPQLRALNAGMWGTLEDTERKWANSMGAIWIVCGPVYYEDDDLYVGEAKARVASAYFKAFLHNDPVNPKAIAFVFQNGANPGNIKDYAMSIDDLEKETGYDFFSSLPDEIENAIEATFNFADWN